MRKAERRFEGEPRAAHRFAAICAGVFVLLCSAFASAQMDMSPLTATSTVNWTSGDVVFQTNFCAESFNEAPDKKSSTPIPYSVTGSIGGAATPFSLVNGTGQTVAASLVWTDLVAGTNTTLAPAVATPMTMSGKLAGCPGGNNGRLTITVPGSALGTSVSGTYSRSFTIDLNNNGSGRTRRTATVTLSIVIPATIRISNVSDFTLGLFDGVNDLVGADTMCVYKNAGNLFGITASGSGGGGAFLLSSGAQALPYSVTWQDTLGTATLTAGTQLSGRGNAFTANATCNGGASNNVTVTVRVLASNLSLALPGTYSGVLTLMVAPQ